MTESTHKEPKPEQKRPQALSRLEYSPIRLPSDFPITMGGGIYRQGDKPITRLHLHDCLELGFCHSGSGIFVVEDKVLPYRQGDVSIITHREMHLAQSTKGTVSEWTFVCVDPIRLIGTHVDDADVLDTSLLEGSAFLNIVSGRDYSEISALMRRMVKELSEKADGYRSCIRALLWTLLISLRRLPRAPATRSSSTQRTYTQRIAPALQNLTQNYTKPVRVADLARLCAVSPTHFRRLFIRAVGKSPMSYLAVLRTQMAAALLTNTDHTILDISMEVGYSTLSSFNRQFRRIMRMPPRQWRKMAH